MPINENKKVEKLNKFMKTMDDSIYEWMFISKHVLTADYKYLNIYESIKEIVREVFFQESTIYNLGSRVMGLAEEEVSDLDFFIDIGKFKVEIMPEI